MLGLSLLLSVWQQPAVARQSVRSVTEIPQPKPKLLQQEQPSTPPEPAPASLVQGYGLDGEQPPPAPPPFEPTDYVDPSRAEGEPVIDTTSLAQTVSETVAPKTMAYFVFDTPRAAANDVVRGVLQVDAPDSDAEFEVDVQLPETLELFAEPASGVEFDEKARKLKWKGFRAKKGANIGDPIEFKIKKETAPGSLDLVITLQGDSLQAPLIATSSIKVGQAQVSERLSRKAGGRATLGQRVSLDFAPDALPRDTAIEGVIYDWKPPTKGEAISEIEVTLGPDMTFEAPVTLTLDLNGLIDLENYAALRERIVLQHVQTDKPKDVKAKERATVRFEDVPTTFDSQTGLLTAHLQHFSDYIVTFAAPEKPKPWKLSANSGSVSLFRGSMNYAYPFSVPGLPDGLQPNLAAEYSSAGGDSKADGQYVPGMHWSLGMGWSVQIPHISRQVQRYFLCSTTVDANGYCWNGYTSGLNIYNLYTLSMGGQSYNLVHRGGGEYVTEDYSPIRIRQCNSTTPCSDHPAISNASGEFWQVWTPDGVRYVFGVDTNSESAASWPPSVGRVWLLRRVYSPLRDDVFVTNKWTMQYTYEQGTGVEKASFLAGDGNGGWVRPSINETWRRPLTIEYGYHTAGANWRNKVTFTYNSIWPRIRAITVQAGNGTTAPTNLMQYQTFPTDGNEGEITGIQSKGWNGSAWVGLPQTTFGYATFANDRKLINNIKNGYGGEWQYSYMAQPGITNTRVVNQMITLNGQGGSNVWKRVDTYSYASPCTKGLGSPCINYGRNTIIDENDNSLIGFGNATHKSLTDVGGTVLASDKHWFHQDYRRLGREYQSEIYNGDTTAAVLQSSSTVYNVYLGDGTFQMPHKVFAVRAANSKAFPGPINTTPFQHVNNSYHLSGSPGYSWLVRGNNSGYHLTLNALPATHSAEKRWKLSELPQGSITTAIWACLVEKTSGGSWIPSNQRSTRLTTSASCNSATENNLGIVGYAYPASSSSGSAIYMCKSGNNYLMTNTNNCEGAGGYTSQGVVAKAIAFENEGAAQSVGRKVWRNLVCRGIRQQHPGALQLV
jgi:hypothetical protein